MSLTRFKLFVPPSQQPNVILRTTDCHRHHCDARSMAPKVAAPSKFQLISIERSGEFLYLRTLRGSPVTSTASAWLTRSCLSSRTKSPAPTIRGAIDGPKSTPDCDAEIGRFRACGRSLHLCINQTKRSDGFRWTHIPCRFFGLESVIKARGNLNRRGADGSERIRITTRDCDPPSYFPEAGRTASELNEQIGR